MQAVGFTSTQNGSLVREDWRERLLVLLPELALMVVATTCMGTILVHDGKSSVLAPLAAIFIAQLFMQTLMYALVYLTTNMNVATPEAALVSAMVPVLIMMFGERSGDALAQRMEFAVPVAMMAGSLLFACTRLRGTFVLLLLSVITLTEGVDQAEGGLLIHLLGIAALMAVFVLRFSATHISWDYQATGAVDGKLETARSLPVFVQVAAMSVLVGMLCLAATVAVMPLVRLGGNANTSQTTVATSSEGNGTRLGEQRATGEGELQDIPPLTADPTSVEHDEEAREPDAAERDEANAAESASGGQPYEVLQSAAYTLMGLLMMAAIALPVPLNLLRRRLARRAIEQEPLVVDRVGRLYLGIVARLEAAGVPRDEAQTPLEFLDRHAGQLAEFTAPAGCTVDDWFTLTEAYERARYGGIDPTPSELDACWRLYDALPRCARMRRGLLRYLTSTFWRM